MYDSSGHGNHRGRYVVHSHGVASATKAAATSPAAIAFLRDFSNVPEAVAQHSTPVNITDTPTSATTSPGSAGILRARLLVFHGFQIANCPPPATSAPSPPSASGLPCVSAAASTPPGKATAGAPSPQRSPFFHFTSA